MKATNDKHVHAEERRLVIADVRALIAPVVAYGTASNDPREAFAKIVSELIGEAVAVEIAARQYLDCARVSPMTTPCLGTRGHANTSRD